jgi:repressor LexA
METLTKRQNQIYKFVVSYSKGKGYSPSIREIGTAFSLSSTRGVHRHLETLEKKGYLKRESTARSIKILHDKYEALGQAINLPFFGFISAGRPIEAVQNHEEMAVPAALVGRRPCYILQVKGNSMIEDHILNGDFIIVEKCETADDGEVVVALINRESATLKRVYREKNRVRLEPANAKMKPIYVKEVAIQGKVKGVFRRF